jgi:hypothetical protein
MKSTIFVATLKSNHKETISFCENWISLKKLETIFCIQKRLQYLSFEHEKREPFCLSLFHSTLDRLLIYTYFVKALGTQWIGLGFHFPILWEILETGKEEEFWKEFISQHGYRFPHESCRSRIDWCWWYLETIPHREPNPKSSE